MESVFLLQDFAPESSGALYCSRHLFAVLDLFRVDVCGKMVKDMPEGILDTLSFSIATDRRLTLRVDPVVNGSSLSARFVSQTNPYRPAGLALGVRDCDSWPPRDPSGRLVLLSCGCGAYDARVTVTVHERGDIVRWCGAKDLLSGEELGGFVFDKVAYSHAVAGCRAELRRVRVGYAIRVWWNMREESLPFGLVFGPTDLPLFVVGFFCAVLLPGDWFWFVPGVLSVLWWSAWSWFRYSPWTDFPDEHGRGCMFHRSDIFLRDNWWLADREVYRGR